MMETETVIFKDKGPILEAVKEIAEHLYLEENINVLHGMLTGYMSIADSDDWREAATRLTNRIVQLFIAIDKNTEVKEDW